jgi:hypothetical protein
MGKNRPLWGNPFGVLGRVVRKSVASVGDVGKSARCVVRKSVAFVGDVGKSVACGGVGVAILSFSFGVGWCVLSEKKSSVWGMWGNRWGCGAVGCVGAKKKPPEGGG